jgi:hypothetical protein
MEKPAAESEEASGMFRAEGSKITNGQRILKWQISWFAATMAHLA